MYKRVKYLSIRQEEVFEICKSIRREREATENVFQLPHQKTFVVSGDLIKRHIEIHLNEYSKIKNINDFDKAIKEFKNIYFVRSAELYTGANIDESKFHKLIGFDTVKFPCFGFPDTVYYKLDFYNNEITDKLILFFKTTKEKGKSKSKKKKYIIYNVNNSEITKFDMMLSNQELDLLKRFTNSNNDITDGHKLSRIYIVDPSQM